jgi:endonuclease/exonuclease/phosphatase family metal-dependent hydrolase
MKTVTLLLALALVPGALPGKGKGATTGDTLVVMTFNVRYANPNDGANAWPARREGVREMIRGQRPDVMGTQELLHSQLQDMLAALPGYACTGVGREDGKTKGEYCALFYREERLEMLDGGTFWLSATPAVPGKGWDAACERVVTWAKLREKRGGKVFFAFNTHFDHVGNTARRESAALLKARIKEIAGEAPVVVTGDFNATSASTPLRVLVDPADPGHLANAADVTPVFEGPRHSYHDFGRLEEGRRQLIDHVLVKNGVTVTRVQVLDSSSTGGYISDHYPVIAVVGM